MASSINTILEELYSLQRLGIKVGLEHTVQLLDQIGNPHKKLRLIHVAGTNGKGSTCSILTKILIDHGLKVGLYTSPHLKKFNERIQINNCQISDEYIANFFNKNRATINEIKATFFETTTAMAFKYFKDQAVDYAVIETGLGGRLDSTNVIIPKVCGITSISFSPTKPQRDTLYKAGVNPIANIPGAGVILFGDKTKLARPSAFDRINVRRLFLTIETAIERAARDQLFEFNDVITRTNFLNIVDPFLRDVKAKRGITDFVVICDETNNTPAVVDSNQFKADIFIKPARSINFIGLTFVATRTGVSFEEVVGNV